MTIWTMTHRFERAFVKEIKWRPEQILQRPAFTGFSSVVYWQLLCAENNTVNTITD